MSVRSRRLVDEDETHAIGDAFIDDRGGRLAGENDDRLGAKLEQKLDERGYVLAGVGGIQKEALLTLAQEPDAQQVQLLGNEGRGEIGATTPIRLERSLFKTWRAD